MIYDCWLSGDAATLRVRDCDVGWHADEWYVPVVTLANTTIQACGAGLLSIWAPVLAHNIVPCFSNDGLWARRKHRIAQHLTGLWMNPLFGFRTSWPPNLPPCVFCAHPYADEPYVDAMAFGASRGYAICRACAINNWPRAPRRK